MIKKLYDWFQRHDKFTHFIMAFGFCFVHIYFSLLIMIMIEIWQGFRFGMSGRWCDTLLDLLADIGGILLFILLDRLLWALIIYNLFMAT